MRTSLLSAMTSLCTLLAAGSCAFAAGTPIVPPLAGATAGQWQYLTLSNGFPFDVLLPYGYSASYIYPVVLYLHGLSTSSPAGTPPGNAFPVFMNSTDLGGVNLRADYPAIIVAPQCVNSAFGSNDWGGTNTTLVNNKLVNSPDMPCGDNAIAALKQVIANTYADPAKIYIAGYSLGGFGTYYLYATHRHLFAAAIPVSGSIYGGVTVNNFEQILRNKPLWAFHGFDDTTVPKTWDEAMYTRSMMHGGIMKYIEFTVSGDSTTYPYWLEPQDGDGHANADTSAFVNPATLNWLFAQTHTETGQ